MDNFKGTLGPWKIVRSTTSIYIQADTFEIARVEAHGENGMSELECENARLISAAPELLSALELLVHYHMCEQEGISSGQPSAMEWYGAVDKASEAISKALGREVENGGT